MAMVMKNPERWKKETEALRKILISCGLTETVKWGKPCYSYEGTIIVIIQGFKSYVALLFFKGYAMNDSKRILVKTGPNTRVGRQIRFTESSDISKMKSILTSYIKNALEVESSGKKMPAKKTAPVPVPKEIKSAFAKDAAFRVAFNALTPGRQRGYLFYFSGATQATTRESRIEKSKSRIMKGKGLHDR